MRKDEPTVRPGDRKPPEWGSDAVASVLGELGLPYISLTPGSSYRGLHDSLVNYLGNTMPQMLVCLHEEHAVALAHGYAKVAGRPMAVALHSNVGLMHASMAVYNAFCDRVPMLIIGATGPADGAARRPWIDWIHTSADQGALVRNYTKWDDQPASVQAAVDAIVRADVVTRTYPCAPAYVCLDVTDQESRLEGPVRFPDLARHQPPAPLTPEPAATNGVLTLLERAERPLLLIGRVSRSEDGWRERVSLAEALGCAVLTDLKVGAGFPSDHPLNPVPPGTFLSAEGGRLLRQADLILSLDWVDLGGTLRQAFGDGGVPARVIACSMDFVLHNGWSKDHFGGYPADLAIPTEPDLLVRALCGRLKGRSPTPRNGWPAAGRSADMPAAGTPASANPAEPEGIPLRELAKELNERTADCHVCLVRLPLGWAGQDLRARHPLDYLGQDGGAGIGSGPGMVVGAGLALAGSGRIPVGVLGDGDYLMGSSALWTAAHYRIPLLVIVANNRSFMNDEIHQQRVAVIRERPTENRWLGQRISDPDPDLAAIARSLGLVGHGPVREAGDLRRILKQAISEAERGSAVVVDVHVGREDYT